MQWRFFRRLKRWWCRHAHAHKTERIKKNLYRKRCLECGEIFLYRATEPKPS